MEAARASNGCLEKIMQVIVNSPAEPIIPADQSAMGYDPEMLYVECGRCGSPVMWGKGRATHLMEQAGIDPLELDASCLLVTDGCPLCGAKDHYNVQIFRMGTGSEQCQPPYYGNA